MMRNPPRATGGDAREDPVRVFMSPTRSSDMYIFEQREGVAFRHCRGSLGDLCCLLSTNKLHCKKATTALTFYLPELLIRFIFTPYQLL